MNPAILGFVRHGITLAFGMILAKTSLQPSDIDTLASAAILLINWGWYAYDKRAELIREKQKAGPC